MTKTPRNNRRIILALAGVLSLALAAGCSKDDKKESKAPPATKTPANTADKAAKPDMKHAGHDMAKMADKKGDTTATAAPAMDPEKMKNARKVDVKVDAEGFKPGSIDAKSGEHLKLVFTRISEKGCGTEVVFANTKKEYKLPLNKAVEVPVVASAAGEITFACGMNMMKGKVVVQ